MSLVWGLDPVSLILGLLVFIFFWKISQSNEKAGIINKLPGPTSFPVVGNIIDMLEPREEALKNILERRQKFGSLFRLWIGQKPVVVFGKPEYVEMVIKGSKHSEKGFGYCFLHPWLGTGLLTSHGQKWAVHRKLITPSFHFKVLQSFMDVFHENASTLASKLQKVAESGEEFDIYSYVTLCTLDIICETAMRTKVNAQSEIQSEYVRSVYRLSDLVVCRMSRLWLHPDIFFKLSSTGKEFQKHLEIVQGFTKKVIQSRKKAFENSQVKDEEKKSFLDLLLESSMEGGSSLLTDEELREEVETFMFEGHDTTASALAWTLSLLGEHSQIQEDCYREQQQIFQNDPDRNPSLSDLTEMKLLERVIKESLRMYPSVTAISRVLEEDIQCGEHLIPKGTDAMIAIYSIHWNPEYYPEPEKFNPDRFLPENSLNRHPYSYIPFSAGPRNCIGQKFALFEEKVILSTLLRKYKFESLMSTEKTVQIPNLVLRPGKGIYMKISKR